MRFSMLSCALIALSVAPLRPAFGQQAGEPSSTFQENILSQFSDRLKVFQDLTWEEWKPQLPQRGQQVDQPDLDPARADFFGAVQMELNLDDQDTRTLEESGLVLIDPHKNQSFPAAYYNLYTRDLPLLITTDSILHAFHHSYDKILVDLESNHLRTNLERLLADSHAELAKVIQEHPEPVLHDTYRDVDLYLTVARSLLADATGNNKSAIRPLTMHSEVIEQLLDMIVNGDRTGMQKVMLYGGERTIDFTQFVVRGHYDRSPRLSSYFRCLMWLGRPDCGWYIAPTDTTTGIESSGIRELRNAALLVQLISNSDRMQELMEIEAVLSVMLGRCDNLSVPELRAVMDKEHVAIPPDLANVSKVAALQKALWNQGAGSQAIRSQVLRKPFGSTTPVQSPRLFQLFGQRFSIDSFALSQVVHDAIVFQGNSIRRTMPTGLDVMAALGNDLAVRLLEPELRQWNYAANLAALRELVEQLPDQYWQDHLYGGWINALRELDRDLSVKSSLPQVFRTDAWRRKQLQTQLASWSELRHDAILYAKASYSTPSCEIPVAYVEPYPSFFTALEQVAKRAAEALKPFPAPTPRRMAWRAQPKAQLSYSQFFATMAEHLATLSKLAQKEIDQQPFTEQETLFLQKTISQRGSQVFGGSGFADISLYDGWYTELMFGFGTEEQDSWRATVADVHTDVQQQQVLEVGVGPVNYCVIIVDQDGHNQLFVGPTYSYYEFKQPMGMRLTDRAWQSMVAGPQPPDRPEFVRGIVGGASAALSPVVSTVREGQSLRIIDPTQPTPTWGKPKGSLVAISREGLEQFASSWPEVRHLDLSKTSITDEDLRALSALRQLRAVNFGETMITDQGLSYLAQSRFLRGLVLSKTPVDDSCLSMIKGWIYLDELDLSDTSITDHGLTDLRQLRFLRKLNLRNTEVTSAGVNSLREALPKCEILASGEPSTANP